VTYLPTTATPIERDIPPLWVRGFLSYDEIGGVTTNKKKERKKESKMPRERQEQEKIM
jgi:hypothetical protein